MMERLTHLASAVFVNGGTHIVKRGGVSGSVITGLDPTTVDPANPIILFIIQLIIIVAFTQGLGWAFKYIKQPAVIAEVIGGILLGKTAFGRIPGFSKHIFPDASQPYLNLVANLGLILFLFVIGLEVDINVIKRNGRKSALISMAGMVLPFGLGAAVAVPVFNNYVHNNEKTKDVSFGHFLLFIGVSMSITAFPVLCRILTATKLLDTEVGVVVLSAGVGNDVVGWVLLALTLALTSPGAKGESSVYILLAAVGWSIMILWPIRKAYVWIVRRSGSLEGNGPTPGVMVITLMIVFTSAFMTGIIGVHPIFGGFIAGLIIPHEGGFAIHLTERIEDLVNMLFIPIYFVLSGLKTDLTKLNDGVMWGYIILLCVVAWAGKFLGCAGVAKLLGYGWRESGAIGMLMSCKGLVELIVLNVGLDAGIITEQVFSMLVFVAVVLTFVTTPCTLWIYPARFHTRLSQQQASQARSEKDKTAFLTNGNGSGGAGGREHTSRLLVVLQRLEHLAPVMFITQLLEPAMATMQAVHSASVAAETRASDVKNIDGESDSGSSDTHSVDTRMVHVDALKLMELTGRTYSVMQSTEKDQLIHTDDALQLYRQFGRLRGVDVTPHLSIVGEDSFPAAVSDYAEELGSELVIIPWTVPYGNDLVPEVPATATATSPTTPFHAVFTPDGSTMYTHFIRNLYAKSTTDVALFIDRGFSGNSTSPGTGQHIFLPFFGGVDDRLALRMVVQLCYHANVTASVVRFVHADLPDSASETASIRERTLPPSAQVHRAAFQSNQLTVGGPKLEEQNRQISETADNIAWTYFTSAEAAVPQDVLSRITFTVKESAQPLTDAAKAAEMALTTARSRPLWRSLLIATGRGRRRAAYNHERELTTLLASHNSNPTVGAELRKTVGDVTTGLILAGGQAAQASYFVCEAGQ